MSCNLTKKEYTFVWRNDSARYATIIFQSIDSDKFVFVECKFFGVHTVYDLDDWDFLRELSQAVIDLCKQEGVTL